MDSRVWFITGTTSGFGRRLALIALSRGDRVIATARSKDNLNSEFSSVNGEIRPNLHLVELDVTESKAQIQSKVDDALKKWGRIDVLVNNAGWGRPAVGEESEEITQSLFDVNFHGAIKVTNAVLPSMRARRQGTLVHIGSRMAWRTNIPGLAAYASTKAALHAYMDTVALEVSQWNIKTLIAAPSSFRTEKIYTHPFTPSDPIPDYDPLRTRILDRFNKIGGTEKGDPDKAMEVLYDVVTGQGRAKGRGWPKTNYLFLGSEAGIDARQKCGDTLEVLDKWGDLAREVEYKDGV